MLRRTNTLFFPLASAAFVACASNEPGDMLTDRPDAAAIGNSGRGGESLGGASASVGASSGSSGGLPSGGPSTGSGSPAGDGGRSGLSHGGSSPSGDGGDGGGTATSGSSDGGGSGSSQGELPTGGSSASGATGEGGGLPAGGSSATGGSPSLGGAASTGGGSASGGAAAGGGGAGVFASCPDATWNLVWGDDFEGASGAAVDESKWAYDSGPNWFNGELQNYTTGADNASLDGNGNLVIEARQEAREGREYTSARLKTEGKQTFTYGRFEGRMKMPYGQGLWPALWMLGGTSWPNDGEIDIMEHLGREPSIAHGTIHGPGYSGADGPSASFTLPDSGKFADDFHIFAVEWEPDTIRWYIDGEHYATKTPADIDGNRWVFDHPFFIILNLAVGGEWPGNPDDTTVFPQKLLIDYVRVCQQ
jgi:hypothetical protein